MCTPQLIEQAANAKAASIAGNSLGVMSSGGPSSVPGPNMGPPADAYQMNVSPLTSQLPAGWANAASGISGLFNPNGAGQPIVSQAQPITREEFMNDSPQVQHMISQSISSIPREKIPYAENIPYERMVPMKRQPTVGELLGIPPGSVTEVGGPGRF